MKPGGGAAGPRRVRDESTRKTIMCKDFIAGHCSYGNNCFFAHGPQELRPHPKQQQQQPPGGMMGMNPMMLVAGLMPGGVMPMMMGPGTGLGHMGTPVLMGMGGAMGMMPPQQGMMPPGPLGMGSGGGMVGPGIAPSGPPPGAMPGLPSGMPPGNSMSPTGMQQQQQQRPSRPPPGQGSNAQRPAPSGDAHPPSTRPQQPSQQQLQRQPPSSSGATSGAQQQVPSKPQMGQAQGKPSEPGAPVVGAATLHPVDASIRGEVAYIERVRATCGLLNMGNVPAHFKDRPDLQQAVFGALRTRAMYRANAFADDVTGYLRG